MNTFITDKGKYAGKKLIPAGILVCLIALFLLQRGGLIFFGFSHISHPYFDEPVSGTLTCDLLDGNLRAPLFVYQYENRSGDVLIEALLLTPLYAAFGRSMLGIKLFALSSALLCLLFWIAFIKRYYGLWAACIFAALFAFPPPLFARLNVVGTLSSHHMINPLIAAQLMVLFLILEKKGAASAWLWAGFGFLAGLGAYTFYSYIIFNTFCVLFLIAFRAETFTFRKIIIFFCSAGAGFFPWALRSLHSGGGGVYLKSMVGSSSFNVLPFLQSFGFNVPHSLSYTYPSREIGYVAILFCCCLIFFTALLLTSASWSLRASRVKRRLQQLSPQALQAIFVPLFALFFLTCLSLSPMHINPFEYWPTYGIFAAFQPADLIRYRWMHILFPFYFATCALGLVVFVKKNPEHTLYTTGVSFLIGFFIVCGIYKSSALYSKADAGSVFYYQGYSYDLMASRFILSDFLSLDLKKAEKIAAEYPEENKPMAYKCLGTKVTLSLLDDPDKESKLKHYFLNIPGQYIKDFVFGIVRTLQIKPGEALSPFIKIVSESYPSLFYENWGYRHLGYKYYGSLINQKILFDNIPSPEQWFFRDFLNDFRLHINASDQASGKKELLREILDIPKEYQPGTIKGLGRLVGAEMLFDPLASPDYPLDSTFGQALNSDLKKAFFEGVGSGFAETLCRDWRRLLSPDAITAYQYERALEIEWKRCRLLMNHMPEAISPIIRKGFFEELHELKLNPHIQQFIMRHEHNA
ncbi:MAG: hypothetical protein WCQ99_02515 [Pseudomonadota bacterium]